MHHDSCLHGGLQPSNSNCSARAKEFLKTIVLIERRALIRECLARCIGSEIGCTVVTFADADSWRLERDQLRPSLVVLGQLECNRSSESGQTFRDFLEDESGAPVVVMCNPLEMEEIMDAFRWGARGVISFDTTIEITLQAIRLTLVGGVFIPAALVFSGSNCLVNGKAASDPEKGIFTAREKAVIQALREGKANKVIASDLRVSESTIKVHIHNVMRKLEVNNRTEAVIKIARLNSVIATDRCTTAEI